ncbi:hypothetical protein EDB83DRAFT_2225435, partial [Lactarius deliciosus]
VASVVGRVLPTHLDCGPRGNFSNQGFGSLQTSKFQLHIGKPLGTVFAADFDKAVANFTTIQRLKASTGKSVNFIVFDANDTNLRFARNVYEKRVAASEEEESVDSDTEQWPVPAELRSQLDGIKHEYRVAPLHVFKNNEQFVEPSNVNDALEESLIEIRFELRHYSFPSKNEHSFNASIEQIVILRPGVARPASSYKRKDFRTGPVALRVKRAGVSTSTSCEAGPSQNAGAVEDSGERGHVSC